MSLFNNAKLILTPNGYKDGKLYTFKPFDGSKDFDVVRATKATRVNSNGLIEEVDNNIIRLDYTENSCPCILVEEQRTNLLLHSEEFDNAYWTKTTGATVDSNTNSSPDGNITADALNTDGSSAFRGITRNVSVNEDVNYTNSIFVKKGSNDFFTLRVISGLSDGRIIVNLLNNSIFTTGSAFNSFLAIYNNSWLRVGFSILTNSTSEQVQIFPNSTGLASAGNQIIWGAQFEQGTEATSYIPTTSSTVTRNADIATVTPPVGVTQIIETFEDNSTNIITSIPSTYQLPVGRIKHIVML